MSVHVAECKRLVDRNNLTYLVDGWEDKRRRSIYGSMVAEVSVYPVMLGLEELTGKRATADQILDLSKRAFKKKDLDPRSILAACTDNPTTMQSFRRKLKIEYPWIDHFKEAISKNTRIVSFFNSSHYWGGQLTTAAEARGIKWSLKTLTESRFYALVLQAHSICNRPDAQRIIQDAIATVFDLNCWDLTDQLIRICKPLVDVIGNIESHDANLADCMLELIAMHHDGDDPEFAKHAMDVLQAEFHTLNTDLHWFALFLHPLCRKLAICASNHSFTLASEWGWKKEQAEKLIQDIEDYYQGKSPFSGGAKNAQDWWASLLPSAHDHPLKAMAAKIFAIVPHTAEVERLFSSLGLSQSKQQTRRTVEHMQTIGTLRNHYIWKVQQDLLAMGKSIRQPGIDLERAKELTENFTWVPDNEDADQEKPEEDEEDEEIISVEDVEAEFQRLNEQGNAASEDGDRLPKEIGINEVYDMSLLDDIWKGKVATSVGEELELAKATGSSEKWDPMSLLRNCSNK
ncbi:ribonuclease H-like domain-containing protein [Crepidotus variabilis]|uniref:Ribonuclease H-like domain-containing protein n=1 Tax=Crepidotus variabilis TaxID=179855 RepID=A0A9P6E342_9AGAR|nr:ribonuclease H-like domain-containing protein [Crepidotus variabilis]